jgi:hypothetical protein
LIQSAGCQGQISIRNFGSYLRNGHPLFSLQPAHGVSFSVMFGD